MSRRDATTHLVTRRSVMGAIFVGLIGGSRLSYAMGQSGAFAARRLRTGTRNNARDRDSALSRWAWELVRRTSAPGRQSSTVVAADELALFDEPFVVWSGETDIPPLTLAERRGLESYLRLGGVLLVDDSRPDLGQFGQAARRELKRVLPESSITTLEPSHVIYKSFYLVPRPSGRVLGPERIQAIVRGSLAQVLFLSCDLLGALATKPDGSYLFDVEPSEPKQREYAIRFAVNIAMYVLCADYKDDQVHAPWLMRRRSRGKR